MRGHTALHQLVYARGQPLRFFTARGKAQQMGQRAAPPGAAGVYAGHARVAFFGFIQQAARAEHGQGQYFRRVAVVEPQDAAAAFCLDAHLAEAGQALAAAPVDGLRIVIEHQQRLRLIGQLGRHAQPGGFKVVRFVYQHGGVGALGYLALVHALLHGIDQGGQVRFLAGLPLGARQAAVIEHAAAPAVKCADLHLLGRDAAPGQLVLNAPGQRAVVAKHEDGAARGVALRQVLRAKDEDHGLARSGHAVNHAVAFAQRAGRLLLVQVHHLHQVGNGELARRFNGGLLRGRPIGDAHFGKDQPAHALLLPGAQARGKAFVQQAPEALAKGGGRHAVGQIGPKQRVAGGEDVLQLRRRRVVFCHPAHHRAPAKGHGAMALVRAAGLLQLRIALNRTHGLQGALVRLLHGMRAVAVLQGNA